MKKIVLGVTMGGSSRLLDEQAKHFINRGYEVYLMSANHPKEKLFCEREGCIHLPVDINKEISPLTDIKSLWQIVKHLRRVKPDIVNIGTPKMALLGLLGAKLTGVKGRIYGCWGLRYETETGNRLKLLKAMEKLTVKLSVKTIYVSKSLLKKSLDDKIADPQKSVIIGKGTSNGIDLVKFNRNSIDTAKRQQLINNYNLQGKIVIGFVGRVSQHKGAYELVSVFDKLYAQDSNICLIMMGHTDCPEDFKKRYEAHPGIIHIPFNDEVPLHMSLFDIFVLPSWREGFPNVPIQAAAMGLPVIVSNATGCIDAVAENINGNIFPVKDEDALFELLLKYINNPSLRKEYGVNGIEWAKNFTSDTVWEGLDKIYKEMIYS